MHTPPADQPRHVASRLQLTATGHKLAVSSVALQTDMSAAMAAETEDVMPRPYGRQRALREIVAHRRQTPCNRVLWRYAFRQYVANTLTKKARSSSQTFEPPRLKALSVSTFLREPR